MAFLCDMVLCRAQSICAMFGSRILFEPAGCERVKFVFSPDASHGSFHISDGGIKVDCVERESVWPMKRLSADANCVALFAVITLPLSLTLSRIFAPSCRPQATGATSTPSPT